MNICDEDFCLLCSIPGSCCDCEFSDFTWSRSTFQESLCAINGREKPANFDMDELASWTIDRDCFPGRAFENPDLEIHDDTIQCPGCGSQQPCAASIPKDNDYAEKWESPGAMPPPDSSSPVGFGTNSSPFSTDLTLPMSHPRGVIEGRLLLCRRRDGGQLGVKALFNDRVPTTISMNLSLSLPSTPKFQIQEDSSTPTDMGARLQTQGNSADTSESSSSTPGCSVTQGSPDERLHAQSKQQIVADDIPANVQDICAVTTRTAIEQTNNLDKPDEVDSVSVLGSPVPAPRMGADLAISTELESTLLHSTENDRPHDATATYSKTNGNGGVPAKMPPRRLSIIPVPCLTQATRDNRLKRRRSSDDCPPESKKVKLDRLVSHVSYASDSSAEFKYQATQPASIRRAQSLRSELSAYSEESTDSLFYPSPLSSPTSRPCPDKDYPSTVPSTPLPDSVDYARSKANPLCRTVAVYRHRSLNIPVIPSVPIIAPPAHITPTFVRCAEDQAVERLRALLLRERSERERDGLHVHDEKRTERLKATYATDLASSRRDSASTSDSSDGRGQWEEESTISGIELQESQDSAASVRILPVQRQVVDRGTWSTAFGITNNFRKEVTGWIFKKLPEEPVPCAKPSRDQRQPGIDLYDQLANSRQTRFHAAHLFHRYFIHPEKVEFWRGACEDELFGQECWGSRDNPDWERGVWDLAVACVALSVKLHRDCLPPLGPVYAAEFLDLVPHTMTHEAFELAQRDIMYTFQFLLGSCTPQDVLDELWNALPTLRKATAPIRDGWAAVQCVTWDKLFESLLETDVLQYPITLLTAAALVDGLVFALARHYETETEANVCKCKAPPKTPVPECVPDDNEATSWQIHLFEAAQSVDDVILDVKDVLQLSEMELDECRRWLSYVGQE